MTAADLILVNGEIRTLDPNRPRATALAIADGALLTVGTDDEAIDNRGDATEVVDLGGAAVTPGLVDSHIHPIPGPFFRGGIDLTGVTDLDEVRSVVAAAARRAQSGEWITGYGLDYELFRDTGISGEMLAEAASGIPALLHFFDMHTAVATPPALERAGIDGPRQFEEHAEIICVDGVPTGELREHSAAMLVTAAMPELTSRQQYQMAVENFRRLAAVGVTGVHAMDGDLPRLDLLRELEANGDLLVRISMPFWLTPGSGRDEWEACVEARDEHGRRWSTGVAKFIIDGVIDVGTAWLFEPDSQGEGLSPYWPDPSHYREAVAFMASRGFQCVTHACGDRAVFEALEAYREAGAAPGVHHRIEHVETLRPEDLPRFAAEGVIASMQAQHMMWFDADRTDNWSRRLGPERCDRAFPIRSLLESGARLTLGSDWPVARFDPREGMAAARLRRPPGERGRDPYDDQAISALLALEGYTAWPAKAVGEGSQGGTLTPGKRADVTVFAADPVGCPADDLPDNDVLMTVVEGEVTHRSPW